MTAIKEKKIFIIDFDSTITKVEGLDQLAAIALAQSHDGDKIVQQIKELTDAGMNGELSLSESLSKRMSLLNANKKHVDILINFLLKNISDSFERNKKFLTEYADQILVVSSGFKDFIIPVIEHLGLKAKNVYANTFIYNENGDITGVDNTNVLSQTGGK